ncbi:MAG TPA: amidohydrolase family protein [Vicinamibacteria bacterium]|nr:amidohydrolase family protein [Vicinamibacteria bacterium]
MARHLVLFAVALSLAHGMVGGVEAQSQSRETLVLENVHVIPMDGERVVRDVSVVVRGGEIAAISRPSVGVAPAPAGAQVVDGRGGFLIPGLWDMHVHVNDESDLAMLVAHGVTGARDMFGSPVHLKLRELVLSGEILGPELVLAGPIIEGEPPPELASVISTEGRRMVATFEDGSAAVREQHEAGYDFAKVYNNVPAEAYRGIVEEAKRLGIPVAGHVPFEVGLEGVIAHGQASIEHLRGYVWELVPAEAPQQPGADLRSRTLAWNYADAGRMKALAAETRAAGIWNTPTLTAGLIFKPAAEIDAYLEGPEGTFVEDDWKSVLRDRTQIAWLSNFSDEDFRAAERSLEVQRELVRRLAEAGARLLAGTDRSPWGLSLHAELRELVASGLTPYEALACATLYPADYLERDDGTGRVAVGSPADLVLLGANPLEDISRTLQIEGVVRRGRWLDRASLDSLIETRKAP